MRVIQPAASPTSPGAQSAPASRGAGAYTDFAEAESPKREPAPKAKRRADEPDSAAAVAGQTAASSEGRAKRDAGGADAAARREGGRETKPAGATDRPDTARRTDAVAVTGRTLPADAGTVAAAARPVATTLAAALQAQAEGIVAGAPAGEAAEPGADADGALAEGAKRLASKGGGEAPAVSAPGAAAPADKDKKTAKSAAKLAAEPVIDPKAAAKAAVPAPAAEIVDPAADIVRAGAEGQPQADRAGPTLPTTSAPAPSGVQPHAGQATPGLHVGAQLSANLAAQVAGEIAAHAGSRRTRFEVRLDPAELGRVDVRLDIAHDGRVQTRLIVERPETLDMLRNDSRELARTLEQAGFQLGQGGLAFQLKEGRAGLWEASERRGAADAEPEAVEDVAPAAYRRTSAAGAGGVDMTV